MMMNTNKTKICCLNIDSEICEHLSQDFDVYNGSLGKIVDLADYHKKNNTAELLLNYDFPKNVHEYEVFISDLRKVEHIGYNTSDHTRSIIIGDSAYYFISNRPETQFNPVPFGCWLLRNKLKKSLRPFVNIIFQAEKQDIKYTIRDVAQYGDDEIVEKSNYLLTVDLTSEVLYGKEIQICKNEYAKALFVNFEDEIEYFQTFIQPTKYDSKTDSRVPDDKRFIPLLTNKHGEIISYIWVSEQEITFMLPQVKSKKLLLDILFKEILFRYLSEYFPEIAACSWKNQTQYYLPGQLSLHEKKNEIIKQFEESVKQIDWRIEENEKQYKFLHDILTETGDVLVEAIITYLTWLGFERIIDKDKTVNNDVYEEDIQVDLGALGLLIIEVKGLHGTSKDSECAQISKIKYRRCEERERFDVFALYIVNNERSIEPLKRTIPPFNDNQIKDAKNDKRGLLFTWQLFNLFFNIEDGFITKEEARARMLNTGLIDFTPSLVELGKPYKYFQDRTVVCVDLNNVQVSNKDILAYEKDGRYYQLSIAEIQQDGNSIEQVSDGKVGIKVDKRVPHIDMLYLFKHQ